VRYERRLEALAPTPVFRQRLVRSTAIGLAIIAASLAVGMAGYGGFEGLGVVDAFLNASMILSGMGPVHTPVTVAGKIFAGCYALYSGLAVLVVAAIIFGPVIHRVLHRFHLEGGKDDRG
jgi:hypothetical protein